MLKRGLASTVKLGVLFFTLPTFRVMKIISAILIGYNPSARGRFCAGSGGLGIPPERAGIVWRAGDGGDQGEAQRRACQGEQNVIWHTINSKIRRASCCFQFVVRVQSRACAACSKYLNMLRMQVWCFFFCV